MLQHDSHWFFVRSFVEQRTEMFSSGERKKASTTFPTSDRHRTSLKKRKSTRAMHPRNKYAENPPNFSLLASIYPSFREYVSYTHNGKARIDWTDFNATRELTRVLLQQDYGIEWWIPNGQLCPTVPNRANYIHWVEDLLYSCSAPWHKTDGERITGLDIGTGANCIYPLLGAALHGWHFVGTDVTHTALEWAQKNVQQNTHLAELIEIRNVKDCKHHNNQECTKSITDAGNNQSDHTFPLGYALSSSVMAIEVDGARNGDVFIPKSDLQQKVELISSFDQKTQDFEELQAEQDPMFNSHGSQRKEPAKVGQVFHHEYKGPPVLAGVVNEGERFDFCMCNPPFFESIDEAGANPRTACGGTSEEMVCPGGEEGFITQIIDDSTQLKEQFHWFTTMVGRKVNLKVLIPKVRHRGVTMLRTTEFVQGRTSRWGLAWSFSPAQNISSLPHAMPERTRASFMLEGLPRQCKTNEILKALARHLQEFGADCKVDMATFSIIGTFSDQLVQMWAPNGFLQKRQREAPQEDKRPFLSGNHDLKPLNISASDLHFSVSVFEQAPGALLIKGAVLEKYSSLAGVFSPMFSSAEQALKQQFCLKSQHKT